LIWKRGFIKGQILRWKSGFY